MEAPQHSRGNGSAQSQRWQDTARPLSCKQIWKIGLRMFSYVFLYSSHGSLCCYSPWQTAWPLEAPAHFGPLIQPAQGATTDIWTHSDKAQLIVFSNPTHIFVLPLCCFITFSHFPIGQIRLAICIGSTSAPSAAAARPAQPVPQPISTTCATMSRGGQRKNWWSCLVMPHLLDFNKCSPCYHWWTSGNHMIDRIPFTSAVAW